MNKSVALHKSTASILTTIALGSLLTSSAYGFSAGFANGGAGCNACHNAGSVQIDISGPVEVARNSTHSFTVTITGGPAVTGGFNIAAVAGLLSATQTGTALSGAELVQSTPKSFSGNAVSWTFDWTAPDVLGAVDLMAGGISADGIGGAAGDFSGISTFTVQVVPIPAALLLFSSSLGVLGWMRRRTAA